jgi:hypothetical protein
MALVDGFMQWVATAPDLLHHVRLQKAEACCFV